MFLRGEQVYRTLSTPLHMHSHETHVRTIPRPTGSPWLIYHEGAVINGELSLGGEERERGGVKLGQRQQLGSHARPVRALTVPWSVINQAQIKGLSARVMFNLKNTVRWTINNFLFVSQPNKWRRDHRFWAKSGELVARTWVTCGLLHHRNPQKR